MNTVWVLEPNRDDWVAGVYATLDAAVRDNPALEFDTANTTTSTDGLRSVPIANAYGYLTEWLVVE